MNEGGRSSQETKSLSRESSWRLHRYIISDKGELFSGLQHTVLRRCQGLELPDEGCDCNKRLSCKFLNTFFHLFFWSSFI